jgi:hypothetical protein
MTIATARLTREQMTERLRCYRTKHVIVIVPSFTGEAVCQTDNIRIIPKRGNVGRSPWRHDPDEIKALSEGAQA